MTTFHNLALKIETSFKLQSCLSPLWKLKKSMIKVETYWDMLKMQQTTITSNYKSQPIKVHL